MFGSRWLVILSMVLAVQPAQAGPMYKATFSGTITNSFDNKFRVGPSVGMLFGGAVAGGQRSISGEIYFDAGRYEDIDPRPGIGYYFSATNDSAYRAVITIDGKTFDTDWFDRTGAPYYAEEVRFYNNSSGIDWFNFNQQAAYKPISNQGAFGQISLSLSLVDFLSPSASFTDFIKGTGFDQFDSVSLLLDSDSLSKLETRRGEYVLQLYCGWQDDFGFVASGLCPEGSNDYPGTNAHRMAPWGTNAGLAPASGDLLAVMTDARGEFRLTAFTLERYTPPTGGGSGGGFGGVSGGGPVPVPEPATSVLLGLGLIALSWSRRRISP